MDMRPTLKVVVVGDVGVGKKSLLLTFSTKSARSDHCTPSSVTDILDEFPACVKVDSKPLDFLVHGISGQEECDRLRPISYNNADIFMICYAVDNRESFRNARFKWFPEVKNAKSHAPVALVACKTDKRNEYLDGDERIVTTREGQSITKSLQCSKAANNCQVIYCETSAENPQEVDDCFVSTVSLSKIKVKKKKFFFQR